MPSPTRLRLAVPKAYVTLTAGARPGPALAEALFAFPPQAAGTLQTGASHPVRRRAAQDHLRQDTPRPGSSRADRQAAGARGEREYIEDDFRRCARRAERVTLRWWRSSSVTLTSARHSPAMPAVRAAAPPAGSSAPQLDKPDRRQVRAPRRQVMESPPYLLPCQPSCPSPRGFELSSTPPGFKRGVQRAPHHAGAAPRSAHGRAQRWQTGRRIAPPAGPAPEGSAPTPRSGL